MDFGETFFVGFFFLGVFIYLFIYFLKESVEYRYRMYLSMDVYRAFLDWSGLLWRPSAKSKKF